MLKKTISVLAILLVAGATVVAAEVDFKKINCVIADKPVDTTKSVDYKDGKVYFCCGGCPSKFAKDTKKFSAKANHQLVATKQYEQTGCPISGGKVNPDTMVKLAGTELAFCCDKCKGKFEDAKDDAARMELVFSDMAFEKGFKKVKTKDGKN